MQQRIRRAPWEKGKRSGWALPFHVTACDVVFLVAASMQEARLIFSFCLGVSLFAPKKNRGIQPDLPLQFPLSQRRKGYRLADPLPASL